MVEYCRDINETRDGARKLVLSSDSEFNQLIIDGLSNELQKRGMNTNNTNNQELCNALKKYFEDNFKNVSAEEMKRK